jgi:tetratricopeptide (TPR) repeat protein
MAVMARGSTTVFLVLVAVLGAEPRAAETAAPQRPADANTADAVQLLGWLEAGNSAALDEYYSRQQQDYEAGRISDERLYASFHKLYEDSLDNEASYDRWVEAFPNSYAAVLARGVYFYRMAWAVRGDKYLTETPTPQLEAMKSWAGRALPELLASLKLTSKPYLSTLYLLNAAMLQGSAEERRRWYERGMAIDPSNALIRYRYMFSLRPRWGGSYGQMEAFLAQARAQQAPPALLARLAMLIHADKAEGAMQAGDNQKIFDEWQEVLRLAEVAGEQPGTEALIGYTRAAQDLNRPADARRGIERLEERHPEDAWSQSRLGWIYSQAHQDEKAWPLLLRAAEQNDSWAQWVVGHSTHDGVPTLHKAPDQQAGLVWIRRSAEQCFPDAVEFLAARGEKPSAACKQRRSRGERAWWEALIPAAGVLLTSLVTVLAAALRKRAQPVAPTARMQYPPSLRAVGPFLLAVLIMLAAAFAVTAETGPDARVVAGAFTTFGALGLLLMVGSVRVWHVLTADGLEFGRLMGRRGSLKWRDVTRLTYSKGMRWFRIETASGEVARISAMLTQLPEFARAVLELVPSYAIDDGAREALQAYIKGGSPAAAR